jgi:hypothetical protein
MLTLVATTTGCGAPTANEQGAPEPSEGTVRDELTTGQTVTIDDWSGVVRIQNRSAAGLQTHCIGVLWTNNTALTSQACAAGAVRVVAGSQIGIVLKTATAANVTMVRFDHPFEVWNSNKTSHPSTGYVRPIYTGADADLFGKATRVLSIPAGTDRMTTAAGIFHMAPPENGIGDVTITANGKPLLTIDDSGAACFNGNGTDYVNGVLDAVVIAEPNFFGNAYNAMGAEQWYPTLGLMLFSGW